MRARHSLLVTLAALAAPAASLRAQGAAAADTFSIVGRALGRGGEQIVGVQIHLASRPSAAPAVSRDDGTFRLTGVRRSGDALLVKRLGYRPDTIALGAGMQLSGPLILGLEAVAQPLPAVVVRSGPRVYAGPFAQFNARRDRGFGTFITRADITRRKAYRTSDLFRSVANMQVERAGGTNVVRMRGRSCDPLVWMDGVPLVGGFPDIDAIPPSSFEGIEIYGGVATIPPELIGPRDAGGCGVIVLWSRHGEPNRRNTKPVNSGDLLAEVDARRVFTADSVTVRALPLPGNEATPRYPEELEKQRVGGLVLAEFVVDDKGEVEEETVGMVASTDPRFSEVVREALHWARYAPAVLDGHPVRQLVQQRFDFDPKPVADGTATAARPPSP